MSDDLREREPDEAMGHDPAVRGTRGDLGGSGSGVVGGAPGMQEQRSHAELLPADGGGTEDPVRRTRPDEDGNEAGSAMDSGDGEAGRGAATDDESAWLRGASGGGAPGGGG